jgi:hypothetical protein
MTRLRFLPRLHLAMGYKGEAHVISASTSTRPPLQDDPQQEGERESESPVCDSGGSGDLRNPGQLLQCFCRDYDFTRGGRQMQAWDQHLIQEYIDNGIEEGQSLEYKAAAALGRSDGKKREITKDVSAMANAAGGITIYGVKEYYEQEKRHLPERLDGVDRTQFSKEWLEQVINNIEPTICGLIIYPVSLDTGPNHAAYVVDIPMSRTAHQAKDWRYYRRYNFEVLPMADHEVRDVMNRATTPNVSVEFGSRITGRGTQQDFDLKRGFHEYVLEVRLRNLGGQVVNNFQLEFSFPKIIPTTRRSTDKEHFTLMGEETEDLLVCRSVGVLFPKQESDIGREIDWRYRIDDQVHREIRRVDPAISWTLFADNMAPKEGRKPFAELNEF